MKICFIIVLILLTLSVSTLKFKGAELAVKYNSPLLLEAAFKVGHKVDVNSHWLEFGVYFLKFAPLNDDSKKLIVMLVNAGVDVDAPSKLSEDSALTSAARKLDLSTMELLLSMGANPNYPNRGGDTSVLMVCRRYGVEAEKAIRLLIEYNADFTVKNDNGDDCLSMAKSNYKRLEKKAPSNNPSRDIFTLIKSELAKQTGQTP